MITGKVIKWSSDHRDYYIYLPAIEKWLKVKCTLPGDRICTSKTALPRGSQEFDYNFSVSEDFIPFSQERIYEAEASYFEEQERTAI